MTEYLTYVLDWELSQRDFRRQVKDLIHRAEKDGKVLALPMRVYPGQMMIDQITLLLSQVNCEGCDAPCCRRNPNEEPIQLFPPDYLRLSKKYGEQHFIRKGDRAELPMPCPFLKSNRCAVYPDRPLVCVIYPFQPGAVDGSGNMMLALASGCPEGRRIARAIYMTAWRIRQQFRALGEDNFMKGIL